MFAIIVSFEVYKVKTQEVERKIYSLIKQRCITNGGRMPFKKEKKKKKKKRRYTLKATKENPIIRPSSAEGPS